jgi:hypothetical protein
MTESPIAVTAPGSGIVVEVVVGAIVVVVVDGDELRRPIAGTPFAARPFVAGAADVVDVVEVAAVVDVVELVEVVGADILAAVMGGGGISAEALWLRNDGGRGA